MIISMRTELCRMLKANPRLQADDRLFTFTTTQTPALPGLMDLNLDASGNLDGF